MVTEAATARVYKNSVPPPRYSHVQRFPPVSIQLKPRDPEPRGALDVDSPGLLQDLDGVNLGFDNIADRHHGIRTVPRSRLSCRLPVTSYFTILKADSMVSGFRHI